MEIIKINIRNYIDLLLLHDGLDNDHMVWGVTSLRGMVKRMF